ncbi:Bifunctional ligase/repressor BirA [Candidatus Hartigia pinicola]|nr:Bifunctional ligase/repressor BirA [Candidatus Hartigia pinicola]
MKNSGILLKLINILSTAQVYSRQQLCNRLGVTHAEINKHIQILHSWGIDLQTIAGKGYQLPHPMHLLNDKLINKYLKNSKIVIEPIIDSTNQYILDRITHFSSGDTCVAEYQISGRGRRGRQWISPFGCNLYLSMYWRLNQGSSAAIGVSLVVGIIIAETLNKLSKEKVKVKWPNDLYLNNKKLAGILVELTGNTGSAAHIIIGIGINISMENNNIQTCKLINQEWTSLSDVVKNIERNILSINIINELTEALMIFEKKGLLPFINRWFKLDIFLERKVKLFIGAKVISGIGKGINQQGALLLQKENGEIMSYIDGEISLRENEK